MTDFRNKNVLVTGAGHGMGKLMALRAAELGADLIITDVNSENLGITAVEIENLGRKVWCYIFDVSDRKAVYEAAEKIIKEVVRVDILINNAGIVYVGEILDLPDEMHIKQAEVNIMGVLWMLKAFVPDMVKRNDGHIVTIASSAGMLAIPGLGMYCATKHALMGLNEALRNELWNCGVKKIKTTIVCPYIVKTGMFEGMKELFFQPALKPEDMVNAAINGILKNRKVVGKPATVFLPPIVKALFPPAVMDFVSRITGLNRAVYSCRGFYSKK